ncbi:glycosyl transferase [Mycobacterium sp. CBMA271]|uniref:glycosyltransferase n=1 Tax=unclassified Mycobacteroides TaxID=2618759 RepID=UPI00132A61AB|nr:MULTISPECIES: nucleotide disphospho-sugar-binding domain-containing protein [unclassified Mycobacteroides]MUM17249.1 glycosyl transferase [Mycobacteroides sp. CBMA 326]MUM23919.1 glycosyl transferase [Mycobacteroides sp. CBMA 271]
MRVAVVAGPDPGHAFPAIALCLKFAAAGDDPVLLTGTRWLEAARAAGLEAVELLGLQPRVDDDDEDSGAKIHQRAAHMAVANLDQLRDLAPDLIVSDVITACGGMAAELLGVLWVELNPHPLYLPSKGLPPLGSGLAPGIGWRGRLRDGLMRRLTQRSIDKGLQQRSTVRAEIGLPARDPGPVRRLIATLPALEVPRPDWPDEAVLVGPLHWEPTDVELAPPSGTGPVVVIAPSTAFTGAEGMTELAVQALESAGARVVISALEPPPSGLPSWAVAGLARQDLLLSGADLAICGGGHGFLSKALLSGVPVVVVPGGGDQWELANRVVRQGSAELVRPLTRDSLAAAVGRVLGEQRYTEAARRAAAGAIDVQDPVRVCQDALAALR